VGAPPPVLARTGRIPTCAFTTLPFTFATSTQDEYNLVRNDSRVDGIRSVKCDCTISARRQIVALPSHLRPRFLSGLTDSDLRSVLSASKHARLSASSIVIHEGEAAERLFLLTSGHGRHFVLTRDGKKIPLHWLTPGQIFGAAAITSTPIDYLASTELLSDGCALIWSRPTIRRLVSKCPGLLDNALSIAVTEHLAWMLATQISLTSEDARGRIAHLLMSLATGIGIDTPDGIELQIKNEDLAAAANVTPFTASRALSRWQRAGVVTKKRGRLVLRKPELLRLAV
jgi:CRP-like cAMP-binding protein